jgi:hypothetical protein
VGIEGKKLLNRQIGNAAAGRPIRRVPDHSDTRANLMDQLPGITV